MDVEKIRIIVGLGNSSMNLRLWADGTQLFPDGCKIEPSFDSEGRLILLLLNRQSGLKFFERLSPNRSPTGVWQINKSRKSAEIESLPLFGATVPERVEKITGGLRVVMPRTLNPLGRGKGRPAKQAIAAAPPRNQDQPVRTKTSDAKVGDPSSVRPSPQRAVSTVRQRPQADLLAAVETVNQWEQFLGDKMVLTLGKSGGIAVVVEFGEA